MINNKFEITYANKKDVKEIITLVHEVIDSSLTSVYPPSAVKWFYDYHSIDHLEEELDDGAIILVIYGDNKIIGTATYHTHELKRLFIHPKYQKLGLGKMFMEHIENIARKNGDKYITLYANPASWEYYESKEYQTYSIAAQKMMRDEYLAYCMMVKNLIPIDWSIEKAQIKDAGEILDGQIKSFYDVAKEHNHMDMPPMTETVDEVVEDIKKSSVFVAKEDEEIVGAVRGEEKDGACYISRLWVLPSFQGKGVGDALMFAVEKEYDALDSYRLFTGSRGIATIDFYKERGYVETKREPLRDYELVYLDKKNAVDMLITK